MAMAETAPRPVAEVRILNEQERVAAYMDGISRFDWSGARDTASVSPETSTSAVARIVGLELQKMSELRSDIRSVLNKIVKDVKENRFVSFNAGNLNKINDYAKRIEDDAEMLYVATRSLHFALQNKNIDQETLDLAVEEIIELFKMEKEYTWKSRVVENYINLPSYMDETLGKCWNNYRIELYAMLFDVASAQGISALPATLEKIAALDNIDLNAVIAKNPNASKDLSVTLAAMTTPPPLLCPLRKPEEGTTFESAMHDVELLRKQVGIKSEQEACQAVALTPPEKENTK